jgi:MFS family permease
MFADTMILPAIPDLIKDFKISYNTSSWILASFLITGAVMTPIAGRLSDIYGKKKILLIILGIYAIGISVAALSNNFTSLLIARVIQGIGVSIFPIALGIIRDTYTPEKLAVAQGNNQFNVFSRSSNRSRSRGNNNQEFLMVCYILGGYTYINCIISNN